MVSTTPNIDRLEAVVLAIGTAANISVQPRSSDGTQFFTVNRRDDAGFWIGQGDSLADAINALELVPPAKPRAFDVAELEKIAA